MASRVGKIAFVALLFGLFVLGSHPASGHLFLRHWTSWPHRAVFAVIAATISTAWPRLHWARHPGPRPADRLADELHQIFVPERHPGWDDGLADLAGLSLGLLLIAGHRHKRQ